MTVGKKKKKALPKPKTAKDRMKLSIIKQLGLLEKVRHNGWGALSAQECGQVGGMLSRRLKQEKRSASCGEKDLGKAEQA